VSGSASIFMSGPSGTPLINLSDRFGEDEGTGMLTGVRLIHHDLANMIAATREALSKAMSELQRDGVMEMRNRRIAILNRGALFKRASGPSVFLCRPPAADLDCLGAGSRIGP
jgi:Crp-like helix-turn-helix domain